MTGIVALIAFLAGVLLAEVGILPSALTAHAERIGFGALCWMVFAVGVWLGTQREAWRQVWKVGWWLLLLPFGTLVVSSLSAAVIGLLWGISPALAAAIGGACGWYSLSGVAVAKRWGAEAGLIAFSVNFLRELLAFGLVPLVARFSPWAAIALCGATAADTTLPLLAKATNAQGAFTGLISGGFITASVPLLVTLLAHWSR
ncbi:MAG: hypothetical protein IMHGJWDQ_000338 [Candidatus Fervidibacter sp.]